MQVFMGDTMKNCAHQWEENMLIEEPKYISCTFCKILTSENLRIHFRINGVSNGLKNTLLGQEGNYSSYRLSCYNQILQQIGNK